MKNIIVVVGATGSGKDTVADLLCKQYHCNKYGISSVLKKLLHQQGNSNPSRQDLIDLNTNLANEYGNHILAKLAIEQIPEETAIIVGCRVPEQITYLKEHSHCIVIGVECNANTRFARAHHREATKTLQEFIDFEQKENSAPNPQRIFEILSHQCDHHIDNEGNLEDMKTILNQITTGLTI